jgi:hypothetical protein
MVQRSCRIRTCRVLIAFLLVLVFGADLGVGQETAESYRVPLGGHLDIDGRVRDEIVLTCPEAPGFSWLALYFWVPWYSDFTMTTEAGNTIASSRWPGFLLLVRPGEHVLVRPKSPFQLSVRAIPLRTIPAPFLEEGVFADDPTDPYHDTEPGWLAEGPPGSLVHVRFGSPDFRPDLSLQPTGLLLRSILPEIDDAEVATTVRIGDAGRCVIIAIPDLEQADRYVLEAGAPESDADSRSDFGLFLGGWPPVFPDGGARPVEPGLQRIPYAVAGSESLWVELLFDDGLATACGDARGSASQSRYRGVWIPHLGINIHSDRSGSCGRRSGRCSVPRVAL